MAAIFVLIAKVRICMGENLFPRTDRDDVRGVDNGHCLKCFQCFVYFLFQFLISLQLAGGMFVFDTPSKAHTLTHTNTPL